MFGKKRIRELEQTLEYYKGLCEGLERRISQVVKQNEQLFNRFMATDFQTLQTFTLPDAIQLEREYDPTADPENAGEVLKIE